MSLLRVDLDASPDRIASYLAVDAAVSAATGLNYLPPAGSALDWQHGEEMWMSLLLLGDSRAILAGWHHEFSLTEGSGTAGEAGTDLVGDAPGWWRRGVEHARERGSYLGFLYGFDGSQWWRYEQPVDDGFDPEIFPVTDYALAEIVQNAAADTLLDDPEPEAIAALIDAGPQLTTEQLADTLHSPDGWPEVDLAAGVAAARSFRQPARTR